MTRLRCICEADHRLSALIYRSYLGALEYVLIVPTMLFGTHGIPFIGLWVFLCYGLEQFCLYFLSSLFTVIITEFLKDSLARLRPAHGITAKRIFRIRHLLTNYSLPSGDSAQAINFLTMAVSLHCPTYQRVLPLAALFGRVYYGVHFLGDILAGAIVGFFCSLLVVLPAFRAPLLVAIQPCPAAFLAAEAAIALLYNALHKRTITPLPPSRKRD